MATKQRTKPRTPPAANDAAVVPMNPAHNFSPKQLQRLGAGYIDAMLANQAAAKRAQEEHDAQRASRNRVVELGPAERAVLRSKLAEVNFGAHAVHELAREITDPEGMAYCSAIESCAREICRATDFIHELVEGRREFGNFQATPTEAVEAERRRREGSDD